MPLTFPQGLVLRNSGIRFQRNHSGSEGVSGPNEAVLDYDFSADSLMLSVNGGAYGAVGGMGAGGDTLTLGASGAAISADEDGAITATSPNSLPSFRAGRGLALGAPVGTITLAENGAGSLTGTFQYAYTETDYTGETTLSAAEPITVAAKTVRVTLPLPRRGTSTRKLYRTVDGGSVFKLLKDFGGGEGTFQTVWDDDTADGSLGANAPSTDTTALYELVVAGGVHNFRTHPDQLTGPADLSLHTGDPSTAGAYGLHNYGTYRGHVVRGSAVGLLVTGMDANQISCTWNDDLDDGSSAVTVFNVDADGKTRITVANPLTDAEPNVLFVSATMPATITTTRSAFQLNITSAGSSAQQQNAMAITFAAGYTGNQPTNGISVVSAVATTSTGAAIQGWSQAGARAVGLIGRASGGTQNMGLVGLTNLAPESLTGISGAIIGSNGDQTTRVLGLYDNTTLAFEVQDGGYIVARGVGTGSAAAGVADSVVALGAPAGGLQSRGVQGSGGAALRVTGAGNNIFWGHSNSEFLCTLGANSGSGVPFFGWYCYHGATGSTQRYASGTNIPVKFQVSTAGVLTFQSAAAGTVDTDITWTTRLRHDADGRLYTNVPNSAPTDGNVLNNQISWFLDEAGVALKARVKKSDGSLLTLTITNGASPTYA